MDISVLIPAYNEEKQISKVLTTLMSIDYLKKVVVVNDGSEDKTAKKAASFEVDIINLPTNRGKAAAIMEGVKHLNCDIIIMLDADLVGLKKGHIDRLIEPMLNDNLDMCIGLFESSNSKIMQQITPNLSGQRAVKKEIFDQIEDLEESGFGIEIALNLHVKKHGKSSLVKLPNLKHVVKEKKFGFLIGFMERIKMYLEIAKTFLEHLINSIKKKIET